MSNKRRSKLNPSTIENPPAAARRPDPVEEAATNAEADVAEQLMEKMAEIGSGGYIRLLRRRKTEVQFAILGKFPVEEFSVDMVQETFGGGMYQAKAHTSKHRLVKQVTFLIDLDIPSKTPGSTTERTAGSDIADAIRAAREGTPVETGSGKNSDLLLAELMRQNTALVAAIASRPASQTDGELMKLLLAKAFAEKPATPLDESLRLHQMLERARRGEDTEEKEEKTGLEKIIEKVVEAVGPMLMAKFGGMAGGAGPGQIPEQQPQARIAVPAQPKTEQQSTMTDDPAMNQFRTAVLKAAAKNEDPFQWAESMLGFVPDMYHPKIFEAANSDDWFANIFGAQPPAEATRRIEYIQEVRNGILTIGFSEGTIAALEAKKEPEQWAKEFLAWACPSYREELSLIANEEEAFPELFSLKYEENKDWMERLKKAVTQAPEAKAV